MIKDPKFDKQKPVCLQTIKNLTKSAEHERWLKANGASDIIMMANMQNQVSNSIAQNMMGNALQKNFIR